MRFRSLAASIAIALVAAPLAHADNTKPIDNVVVFGDSLSDAGNEYSTALGAWTAFTTNPGPVTVQNVAASYGFDLQASRVGGSDYAYGGAGVVTDDDGPTSPIPTLTQQVNGYLANGAKTDPHSLYMIWGGANDIFYHSTQYGISTIFPGAGETQAQAVANIDAAATQELALISQLKSAGANYFVVINLPDIGATPSAAADAQLVPGIQTFLTQVSQSYNQTLNVGLAATGANILSVNTYALFKEVLADPAAFGLTNTTTQACTTSSSHDCNGSTLVAANAAQTYLFADGVHPTTAAHAIFGDYVLSELRAPGQISLLGEAPLASATMQTRAVRSEMLADGNGAGTRVFATVNYTQQGFDGTYSSPRTSDGNVNLTLGADFRLADQLSAGVALGLGHTDSDTVGGGGFRMQDASLLGYLNYQSTAGGYLGGYASWGHTWFDDVDRVIQLGSLTRGESGSTDGNHYGAGVTGGWWFGQGTSWQNGPFANLEWQHIRVDGYSEGSGDSTAMWFGDQQRKALIGSLGWRLQGSWQVGDTALLPYAELAWNRDSKADVRDITTGLTTLAGSFNYPGFVPDKTWGSADVGVKARFSPQLDLWFGYSGHFSDDSQKYNGIDIGLKYRF